MDIEEIEKMVTVPPHKHKYKLRRVTYGWVHWRCSDCKVNFLFPVASIRELVKGNLRLVPARSYMNGDFFAAVPKEK